MIRWMFALGMEHITLGEVRLKNDGGYQVKVGVKPERLSRNSIEIYELQVAPVK